MIARLLSSGRTQGIALLLVMAAILGGGILATRTVERSIEQLIAATTASRLQAVAAQAVLVALQDAETGQRGYLLTSRPYYLEPYYATIGRIEELLATLTRRAANDPWFENEAARLAAAAREKVGELRTTVLAAQQGSLAAAQAITLTDAGKAYMDEVRAAATHIVDRAEAERARRASLLQRRQQLVTEILLASLCTGVLLLGAAALVLLWNHGRLRTARSTALNESTRLAAAIEHVPDGVAVFDRHGRLTLHNARLAPTLGLATHLAQPGATLAAIAEAAALTPPIATTRPPEPLAHEARQGPRTLEIWQSPMPDGGQMLAAADITRRVAAEEVARQAQKMEVLGQMTGGVAHDFNNLLQVVSANLELVRNKVARTPAPDPALLARIDAASAGVTRGARLTRHLLAFARRQPLAPEPIDPARLLLGMEDVLRRTLGEAVHLEIIIGGGLWSMRADPSQCENALLNLALNARDALAPQPQPGAAHPLLEPTPTGKLTIEVANAALDADYAERAPDVAPGQYVMFAVTDSGAGMSPEQLARATEPFYTTKPDGRGTGLGLPMVLGFAKQSGGHFQLYSEPGRGTTARLYIPRTAAAAAAAQHAANPTPTGSNELVLLVEDDPAVRHAAQSTVTGLGYQVVAAESADAGIALLEGGLQPRILFTDVVMPGQATARDMVARARALVPGIAVLFTSGYTQNSIVHDGQLDADVTLISKPWRTDELARALRAILAGNLRPPAQRRVLLVEDEEIVRMTTADALADLGFDVLEAATATAALARLQPPPDLLLTDLGLPDQNGADLVIEARRRIPGLPVIVLSGQDQPSSDDVIWLPKPYDTESLRRAVARALAAPAPLPTPGALAS